MNHDLNELFDEDELRDIAEQRRGAQRDAQQLAAAIDDQRLPLTAVEAHLRQPD